MRENRGAKHKKRRKKEKNGDILRLNYKKDIYPLFLSHNGIYILLIPFEDIYPFCYDYIAGRENEKTAGGKDKRK